MYSELWYIARAQDGSYVIASESFLLRQGELRWYRELSFSSLQGERLFLFQRGSDDHGEDLRSKTGREEVV